MKKNLSLVLISTFSLLIVSSNAFATAVTANRSSDANDLTAGAAFDNQGAWVLSVADGVNFTTGNITTAGNGSTNAGTVTFAGTSTAQAIGASGASLLAINGGFLGKTLTVAGDVYATTTSVTGGTLLLNGNLTGTTLNIIPAAASTVTLAAGKNINAAVTASSDDAANLNFSGTTTTGGTIGTVGSNLHAINFNGAGATATLANNLFATTTTVTNATLTPSANRSIAGDLTLAAGAGSTALNLGTNTLTVGAGTVGTGIYTQATTTTLNTTIANTSSFGKVVATSANAVVNSGSAVGVTVSGYVPSGSTFKIVDGAGGAGVSVPGTITDNSAILSFSGASASGDLTLTATRANLGTTANSKAVSDALNNVSPATGDMAAILGILDSYTSSAQVDTALKQLNPVVDTGVPETSYAAANAFMNAIISHLSEMRGTSTGSTGVSTGDKWKDAAIWAKGFGNYSNQDRRSGIDGYESWTAGSAIGFDAPADSIDPHLRVGIAGGYAYGNVDSKGSDNGNTDINSYQGTLYSSYTRDPWHVDSAFSFAWNQYEGRRDIAFVNRRADASYDGQQYGAYIDGGYTFKGKNLQGFEITPVASLEYTHLHLDSYTETGADALNLHVNVQSYDVLQSGLGAQLAYPITDINGTFIPSIHAKWLYDFIGDRVQTTSTFTGGGAAFTTNGFEPAQRSFAIGTELKFITKDSWTILANYDLTLKSGFYAHDGIVTVKYTY